MLWIPLVIVATAAIYDLRSREIPDWLPAALLLWAIVCVAAGWVAIGWWELLAGLGLGLAIGLPLFALGGFGGGDVKLVAALGAALGPAALLRALFWIALAGGALALVAKWRGQKDLAYGPAIALGLLIYVVRVELARRGANV